MLVRIPAIGESFRLRDVESRIASHVGIMRANHAKKTGQTDKLQTDRDPVEVDRDGVAGELIFHRMLGIYPERLFAMEFLGGRNDKADVLLPNGRIVDVKTRPRLASNGAIAGMMTLTDNVVAQTDYYVLMVGEWPEFEYRGGMTKKEFIDDKRFRTFKCKSYFAEQSELEPIDFNK